MLFNHIECADVMWKKSDVSDLRGELYSSGLCGGDKTSSVDVVARKLEFIYLYFACGALRA